MCCLTDCFPGQKTQKNLGQRVRKFKHFKLLQTWDYVKKDWQTHPSPAQRIIQTCSEFLLSISFYPSSKLLVCLSDKMTPFLCLPKVWSILHHGSVDWVHKKMLQSNLYKMTTLETTQKWSSWKGGHLIKNLYQTTTNQI